MWTSLVLSVLFFQSTLADLIVQLPNGKVEGTTVDTPSGQTFYAWRGIPYAKPPVNDLRYMPPVKPESWNGILDASKDSPGCVSFGIFPTDPVPLNGRDEDCLYINVYSPVSVGSNSNVNASRTVLVWIYGGGFYAGFSDFGFYDPTAFLEEDIIVVTFNYRLGTFGFLSTEDEVVLGNAGLKDQNLALKWVNENIAFFGGNPQDVTIFGESAGGMSVGYHIVSPMSKGLFKGAIMESGSAVSNLHQSNARQFAAYLANKINSSITNSSSSEEIRDVLQKASANVITTLSPGLLGPVLEVQSDKSFLTTSLYETLEAGDINKVPTIIGYNSLERINRGNDTSAAVQEAGTYDSSPQLLAPGMNNLKENVSTDEIGQLVHDQYVGKDGLFTENLAAFFEVLSDNFMGRSCEKHAALQYKYTPVYMYQFSFYGTLSKDNLIIPGAGKVGHAQEVGYLFNISNHPIETEADYLTRRRFVKLWTNFAKTSNPTPDDDSELLQNVKWKALTEGNIQYLDIDDNLEMKPNRKVNENALWDYLWETYSYRPYNTF